MKVAAVDPPVAIVITSDPLKVIDVFESASPLIESSDKLPTFDMFWSAKSTVPVTFKLPSIITFSLMLIPVESDESSVVPFILIAPIKTSPVPLGWIDKSALLELLIVDPTNVKSPNDTSANARFPDPSVFKNWFAEPSDVGNASPEAVKAPVTSNASAIVILLESDESSVVPFTRTELKIMSPVPLGCMLMSAFEPLLVIEFVVMAPGDIVPVNVPLNVPPLIVGLVKVLLVKVCVAVKPTTCSPPAVEPSCTLNVFVVVSTLISPAAPVNALFCVVFPLLNCSVVGIIISYSLYLLLRAYIN